MFNQPLPGMAGLLLGLTMMIAPAAADALKDEIAPTGKLRIAIAISSAGGAFWSNKNETGGYTGVPVDLGKEMAAHLGITVEYVAYLNSGQITDAIGKFETTDPATPPAAAPKGAAAAKKKKR